MLPATSTPGAIIMALWQFTTIAALIGVLLIYLVVLTNRVGATNALLKRIGEALVKPQLATENVRATAAGSAAGMTAATAAERTVVSVAAERAGVAPAPLTMAPVGPARRGPTAGPAAVSARAPSPTAESTPMTARHPASEPATEAVALEITDEPEVPDSDRRVSFLTVRDLKVIARSGRRSSDGTVGMSPLFREAMARKRAEARSLAESGQSHEDQTSDVVTEEVSVASVVTEETVASAVAGEVRVAATEDVAPASPEMVAPTPAERDTGAANEYAEAAAITMAANEHAAAEDSTGAMIFATESHHATADARSVIPAAKSEAHSEDRSATFASNDEPALEAPAAAVAANDESRAEPDAPTATTEPRPVAAAQPVDEDLLERRRKRDAQLILSAQRRRRRTRGF